MAGGPPAKSVTGVAAVVLSKVMRIPPFEIVEVLLHAALDVPFVKLPPLLTPPRENVLPAVISLYIVLGPILAKAVANCCAVEPNTPAVQVKPFNVMV